MDIDFNNLDHQLTVKDDVLNIMNTMLGRMMFSYPPENISLELSGYLVANHAAENVENIFKYADTTIEKMFLSAVLIFALTKGVFFVSMTERLNLANEKIKIMRNNYSTSLQLWDSYREKTGKKSMNEFIDFINDTPCPESFKEQIKTNMLTKIYDIYNTYFLSIKSNFLEPTLSEEPIKTDIFVWTISNPQFKLLVECDELDYYSDKCTFSNDRARDRLLQIKGYQVLRFSGQEIISNPIDKARELVKYLEKRKNNGAPE